VIKGKSFLLAGIASSALASSAHAAISYAVANTVYSENFNSTSTKLPVQHPTLLTNTTQSGSLQPAPYTEGWKDDTTSDANHLSVSGWYLYGQADNKPASDPTNSEGGFNGHQRFRYQTGSSTTGSFYGYATNLSTDKSLGILSSSTINLSGGRAYIGIRLVNDTGSTLDSVTVSYTGEQWRYGGSTNTLAGLTYPATVDRLEFQYRLGGNETDWFASSGFTPRSALHFVSPRNYTSEHNNTGTATALQLNGNDAANRAAKTDTFAVTWLPGQELWLRWRDGDITGADDGLAVDDFSFSATAAVPEPTSLAFLGVSALGFLARRRRGNV
jgi:hypothetical protein